MNARRKPVVAFFTPHAERLLALAAAAGIPAFRTPEACADAVAAFLSWRSPEGAGVGCSGRLPGNAFELIAALGIPVARWAIAEAPGFSHALGYPVAVKLLEAHKTERGGVVLGVANQEEPRKPRRRWPHGGVLVQEMQSGLAEVIVGYRDDAVVGPLVLVGAGGAGGATAITRCASAPVSETEAAEMIEEVKGLAVIRGYRNLSRGDVKSLACASRLRLALAKGRPVREAEVNPLIVGRRRRRGRRARGTQGGA